MHPLNSCTTKAVEINSTITTQILPLHMTDSYWKLDKTLKRPPVTETRTQKQHQRGHHAA